MSTSVLLSCPQGLTLNNSYTDPANTVVLCSGTPTQPPPSGGSSGGSPPPPSNDPPPQPSTPGPGDSCPNGQAVNADPWGNKICEPLTCPTGTEVKTDSKGTFGCSVIGSNDVLICPYNEKYNYGAPPGTTGTLRCTIFPSNNPVFYVTDNNNNCPVGYNQVSDEKTPDGHKCQQDDSSSGMGNIIATIRSAPGVKGPGYFKGPSGGLGSANNKCPSGTMKYIDVNGALGCTNTPGQTVICPNGFAFEVGDNNTIKCTDTLPPNSGEPVNCITGYTLGTSNGNPVCNATRPSEQFNNIYDFKSKRERKVENFSQIKNSKCKARY
jgi:hypothetical protein